MSSTFLQKHTVFYMNILHISNGFADSKVHSNLTRALDDLGIDQTVYCPVREERLMGKNQFDGKHIKFVYSFCIKPWYKYVYHFKRWVLYRDMKRRIDLKGFDLIHAATLFSDGGLALKAHKKYGIPYIVAVRNTDINIYIHRLRHTHALGREIASKASKIVFISKGEMEEFCHSDFIKPVYAKIKDKIVFQPNGIDDYWHQHISYEQRIGHDVLYIGDFSANKNVVRLAEAVLQLRKEKGFEDVRLIIVGGEKQGGGRKNDGRTQQMINEHPEAIKALGKIYEKDRLREVMHSCALFAMPSIHETFGLVYIEALSQNLPVVFTKGQGIDGLFDESVGVGINAFSVEEISEAIKKILKNPKGYNNKQICFNDFNWNTIAEKYYKYYHEII